MLQIEKKKWLKLLEIVKSRKNIDFRFFYFSFRFFPDFPLFGLYQVATLIVS
jgi:hypothetical protein